MSIYNLAPFWKALGIMNLIWSVCFCAHASENDLSSDSLWPQLSKWAFQRGSESCAVYWCLNLNVPVFHIIQIHIFSNQVSILPCHIFTSSLPNLVCTSLSFRPSGLLVDISHDYKYLFFMCGSVITAGGLFLFVTNIYYYHTLDNKRKQKDNEQMSKSSENQERLSFMEGEIKLTTESEIEPRKPETKEETEHLAANNTGTLE